MRPNKADRKVDENLAEALSLWIRDPGDRRLFQSAPRFTSDWRLIPELLTAAHRKARLSFLIELDKGSLYVRIVRPRGRTVALVARASVRLGSVPSGLAHAIWAAVRKVGVDS